MLGRRAVTWHNTLSCWNESKKCTVLNEQRTLLVQVKCLHTNSRPTQNTNHGSKMSLYFRLGSEVFTWETAILFGLMHPKVSWTGGPLNIAPPYMKAGVHCWGEVHGMKTKRKQPPALRRLTGFTHAVLADQIDAARWTVCRGVAACGIDSDNTTR